MEVAQLIVPDVRNENLPIGWAEGALPILQEADWEELDDYESRLLGMVSYIESLGGDATELQKALRIVECRRGVLLDPDVDPSGGRPPKNSPRMGSFGVPSQTASRYRKIARAWDALWPYLRDATSASEVTQSAILRFIDGGYLAVHYSSLTGEWETPQELFDVLDREFAFTLDVCATPKNAKCDQFFTQEDDGLSKTWTGVCWMNPPYGRKIERWVQKAFASAVEGATVVALVPARVDTGWWWDYCRYAEVRFMRGRLSFGDSETSAPFPSAVVVFGREPCVRWWEWQKENSAVG